MKIHKIIKSLLMISGILIGLGIVGMISFHLIFHSGVSFWSAFFWLGFFISLIVYVIVLFHRKIAFAEHSQGVLKRYWIVLAIYFGGLIIGTIFATFILSVFAWFIIGGWTLLGVLMCIVDAELFLHIIGTKPNSTLDDEPYFALNEIGYEELNQKINNNIINESTINNNEEKSANQKANDNILNETNTDNIINNIPIKTNNVSNKITTIPIETTPTSKKKVHLQLDIDENNNIDLTILNHQDDETTQRIDYNTKKSIDFPAQIE